MATENELKRAGFTLPLNDEAVTFGARHIRTNAGAAFDLVQTLRNEQDRRLEALSADTDEGNIQRFSPASGTLTYTLLPNALTQGVIITQPPAGGVSVTHPASVTWHGGKAPSLDITPGTVIYLVFLKLAPNSFLGFAVNGLDTTDDIISALPESITQLPGYELSSWLRGGTKYLGVYTRRSGSSSTGFTVEANREIYGVIDARFRSEPDLSAFIEPATADDVATAGPKPVASTSGRTLLDPNAPLMLEATLEGSLTALTFGARGSIYSQKLGDLTLSQVGNYTNGFTGNHPAYNGSIPYRSGDTVQVIYADGKQIARVRRAGEKSWQVIYKNPVLKLANDKTVRLFLSSSTPATYRGLAVYGKEAE